MSDVQQVLLLAAVIVGGVSALWVFIAVWAHKQNQRNDPHRHHRGHTT